MIEAIAINLQGKKQSDGSWMVLCPAHADKNPSLHITDAGEKILVNCMAGCSQSAVIEALKARNLWPSGIAFKNDSQPANLPPGVFKTWGKDKKPYVAHWTYYNTTGAEIIGYVVRYQSGENENKDVIPYFKEAEKPHGCLDPTPRFAPGAAPKPRPLYNLCGLYLKTHDIPVLIVEGEKVRDAAQRLVNQEYICMTWPGGSKAANKADWTPLKDRDVIVWPDADEPGLKAAEDVKDLCRKVGARSVKIVNPPEGVKPGWDLADGLAEGWDMGRVRGHIRDNSINDQQPAANSRYFKLVKLSDIEEKAPQYLICPLFEIDSTGEIFSPPGQGKTFMLIDIAACVASGKDFHGLTVRQGPVVYIAGEGQNGIQRRFKAWCIRHGVNMTTLPIFISLMPAGLCDADQVDFVIKAIQAIADEYGNPVLIILDTVARNFGPGDENSTKDMGMFIAGLDAIRGKFGACVLLAHHSGHADQSRARGAMALKGALDAEYRLEMDETRVIRMTCTKIKDSEPPPPMSFRLNTVELPFQDDEGRPATSAILDDVEYMPPPVNGKKGCGKWQTVSLEVLKGLYAKHRIHLESSGYDPDDAKVLLEDWRRACIDKGMTRATWKRVKDSLTWNPDVVQEGSYVRILSDFDRNVS